MEWNTSRTQVEERRVVLTTVTPSLQTYQHDRSELEMKLQQLQIRLQEAQDDDDKLKVNNCNVM